MRHRSWTRRALKWVGTTLCLLPLVGYASSLHCSRYVGIDRLYCMVGVEGGAIHIEWGVQSRHLYRRDLHRFVRMRAQEYAAYLSGQRRASPPAHWLRWPHLENDFRLCWVPLWIPCAALSLPTAVLCWLDRRRISPGHCRNCGYNLTGNLSGTCPECGNSVEHAEERA